MGTTATSLRVRSAGADLHVLVRQGDPARVPFLLVHGLSSNARLWDGVADLLAGDGHGSVAVDLRGHGESDVPESGYDFATITADLEAVIAATLDRPSVAVGQSWGGNVVVEFAARHPERVAAVVAVDGGFLRLRDEFPEWDAALRFLTPPPLDGVPWSDLERGMRERLDGFPEVGIAGQMANFRRGDDGTARRRLPVPRHLDILRHLWEHDPHGAVADLDVPLLVIATTKGSPGTRERVTGFVQESSRGSVVWMDAHHDVHAQYPDEVAGHLLNMVGDGWREAE